MAFLFVLVVVFFHLLNLQFRAFLEVGIDGGCNRAVRSMPYPKADDFTTNSTFLRARDKGTSKVVQVVVWKLTKDFVNERYQHSVNRERIEWMKRLNYVFTFTYDDKK